MTQSFEAEYKKKLISVQEAAQLVQSGDRLHLGGGANIATIIDRYVARRKDELQNVYFQTYIDTASYDMCACDPEKQVFQWQSGFLLGPVRSLSKDRGIGVYIPEAWHTAPDTYRNYLHFNKYYAVTAPMDAYGYFNFGLTTGHSKAISEVSDTVIAVVRKDMPTVFGGREEGIHISDVDYIVEDDETETFCLPSIPIQDADEMIAANILEAGLIQNGSTIQIGIGGLPNAVLESVKNAGITDCGLHTEMLTEKMLDLIEQGVVTNRQKTMDKYKSVFTFALGSSRLYQHIHKNPAFAAYPVNYTNHPRVIARQPRLFSLNSTAQIDLTGQAASEQVPVRERPLQISGTGGQLDFIMGAWLTEDGQGASVLSLYSTYKNESRIVPLLDMGANVTAPRSLVQYVATEWGVANLRGLSNTERARALIAIAHPDFRYELNREAEKLGVISYGKIPMKTKHVSGVLVSRDK
jgi:acyl-CoA hydrolase